MRTFSLTGTARKIIVLGLLIACFMLRPTIGGQTLTPIALFLAIGVLGFDLINRRFSIQKPTTHATCVAFLGVLVWIYFALHAIIMESSRIDFVTKSTIAHIIIIASAYLIFSEPKNSDFFFRYLSAVLMFPIISYAVTSVLAYFVGFDALYLFSMTVEDYPGTGDVLFPITPVYTFIELPGIKLARLSGFFRESGIAQAFYGWGFMAAPFLWRRVALVRAIFAAGMIFSISTVGIFLLAMLFVAVNVLSAGEKQRSSRRKIVKLLTVAILSSVVGSVTYYVNENVPVIGLRDKEERTVSADDRYAASSDSLRVIVDHPLGTGLYSSTIQNSTINLIGSVREIGLPGFLLVLILYFFPPILLRRKIYAAACVMPIFLTALTSQPLMDAPFVYILLLFCPQRYSGRKTSLVDEKYCSDLSSSRSPKTINPEQ